MPLSNDDNTNATAGKLVETLKGLFGTPEGYRPAHARGRLVTGTFTPTRDAASLSTAPHFNAASTPVIVRFSSATGIPNIPDTDGNANPRGMAIRFVLGNEGHSHTDIVTQSSPFFAMSTGAGFLAMLAALQNGTFEDFMQDNPSAAAFAQAAKPSPTSFATDKFFSIQAFKMIAKDGQATFVRYRLTPDAGYSTLSQGELSSRSQSYLYDELQDRLGKGPASFKLLVQVAEDGDPTDDGTKQWPEDRRLVELGTIKLDKVLAESESDKEGQKIIYDPVPRVQGVEPSEDPLLDLRASIYLQSGRQRRAAPPVV